MENILNIIVIMLFILVLFFVISQIFLAIAEWSGWKDGSYH